MKELIKLYDQYLSETKKERTQTEVELKGTFDDFIIWLKGNEGYEHCDCREFKDRGTCQHTR
jgi:hypothetical protein